MDTLFLVALKDEIKNSFQDESVFFTGLGKINASITTSDAILKHKPKLVINLGTAGSNQFNKGEIVNCTKFIQRDMNPTGELGYEKFVTPYENNLILEYGSRIKNLKEAICGTGDSFEIALNSSLYNVVDMESYSIAKVCKKYDIPFICIKYISDGANSDNAADDWREAFEKAGKELYSIYLKEIKDKFFL
jgi:adenosylhomocysteine nucleosidase